MKPSPSVTHAALALVAILTALAGGAEAKIISATFDAATDSLDLTAVGTKDWAAFGRGESPGQAGGPMSFEAGDFKKGGAGISRSMKVSGLTKAHGGAGASDYRFTGGGWSWSDGANRPSVMHWTGFFSGAGLIAEMGPGGKIAFQFAAPPPGKSARAYLLLRRDHPIQLVAVQGDVEKAFDLNAGKAVGVAAVTYDGDQPLTIELRSGQSKAVVRGIVAALGSPGDFPGRLPGALSPRDVLLKQLAGRPDPDYLKLARAYADHMIEFGRDRYGEQHSPLFASTLTRDRPPTLLPYPQFKPSKTHGRLSDDVGKLVESESWWQFNTFLNLPTLHHLGSEDAHKETVVGEDVLEDLGLYRTLWLLSDVTGEGAYRREADKALDWWFTHTQSPATGLYPWGEHLGWDFRHEAVSYSKGPVQWLYSCVFHEPRAVYFQDMLAALARVPARQGFDRTPLERFALGLRDWHVWDLKRGWFTRHGDYFGRIKPAGHSEFPRIAGWFFDVWSAALIASKDAALKDELAQAMDLLIDALAKRVQEVGYFPFTARHESGGGKPESFSDRQVLNAAAKIQLAGDRLADVRADLAAKCRRFADSQIQYCIRQATDKSLASASMGDTILACYDMTRREDLKALLKRSADGLIGQDITADAGSAGPAPWAGRITVLVGAWRVFGEGKYLDAARGSGRLAVALFFDDASPLPKVSSVPVYLPDGKQFPVFYHAALGDDDLMLALTQLAAALSRK